MSNLSISGMSLRDYFASQILSGLAMSNMSVQDKSEYAYKFADAMLAEKERTENK